MQGEYWLKNTKNMIEKMQGEYWLYVRENTENARRILDVRENTEYRKEENIG